MVLTKSTMMSLGTTAPDFSLPDVVVGKHVSLSDFNEKEALLVIFLCRHCPYVKHVQGEIATIGKEFQDENLGIVAISANDAEKYPEDAPESLAEFVKEQGISFPVLYDLSQETAKEYTAACTPDFFLFDDQRKLVYRGQLDDSRPGNEKPVTGTDLRDAIEKTLQGREVSSDQKPSSGCNIKWKNGNEPDYIFP